MPREGRRRAGVGVVVPPLALEPLGLATHPLAERSERHTSARRDRGRAPLSPLSRGGLARLGMHAGGRGGGHAGFGHVPESTAQGVERRERHLAHRLVLVRAQQLQRRHAPPMGRLYRREVGAGERAEQRGCRASRGPFSRGGGGEGDLEEGRGEWPRPLRARLRERRRRVQERRVGTRGRMGERTEQRRGYAVGDGLADLAGGSEGGGEAERSPQLIGLARLREQRQERPQQRRQRDLVLELGDEGACRRGARIAQLASAILVLESRDDRVGDAWQVRLHQRRVQRGQLPVHAHGPAAARQRVLGGRVVQAQEERADSVAVQALRKEDEFVPCLLALRTHARTRSRRRPCSVFTARLDQAIRRSAAHSRAHAQHGLEARTV